MTRVKTHGAALRGVAGILAAFLGILAATLRPVPVSADHNGPWLPGDPMNYPTQARMAARGYETYCFDSVAASYPNLRAQARTVADYAASKGSIAAYEVGFGADCDVRYQAPTHAGFVTLCGAGAYGCNFYWHDGIDIYIDLQGPNAAYYNESTLCHEGLNTGHTLFLHEEYHDLWTTTPPDVHSNGRTWTCMDYGVLDPTDPLRRNVWALPDWDRDRIFNAFVPDAPSSVTLTTSRDGSGALWARVAWSQNRADGGVAHLGGNASNTSAQYVVFGAAKCDGCPIVWAGDICGPAYGYCAEPYKDGARWFDPFWRGCLYVRAYSQAWDHVPQISAPNYWTKAGCF